MESDPERRLLLNRTVLIPPSTGETQLTAELERHGARVIGLPPLKISPPESCAAIDEAIESLYGYDWLIFTNANGADYFLRRFRQLDRETDELDAVRVCAIGEKTSRRLEDSHVHVDLVPEHFQPKDILAALSTYVEGPQNLGRLNFLIPRAASTRDHLVQMLEEVGARVDVVAAYRTLVLNNPALTQLNALLAGGGIDCVVFTSRASIAEFAELVDTYELSRLLTDVVVACVDEKVAESVSEFGLRADITLAKFTTIPALVDAIVLHFSR